MQREKIRLMNIFKSFSSYAEGAFNFDYTAKIQTCLNNDVYLFIHYFNYMNNFEISLQSENISLLNKIIEEYDLSFLDFKYNLFQDTHFKSLHCDDLSIIAQKYEEVIRKGNIDV